MAEHVLRVSGLRAEVAGREVLTGVDLEVRSGEVHVIMGPNGSGKSTLAHALMGRPGYTITSGSILLDGVELVGAEPAERAQAGLFLALQQPIEVPGVHLKDAMVAAGIPPADVVERLDKFDALANDLSIGLPAELAARRKQYEYYRDRLLTFDELVV